MTQVGHILDLVDSCCLDLGLELEAQVGADVSDADLLEWHRRMRACTRRMREIQTQLENAVISVQMTARAQGRLMRPDGTGLRLGVTKSWDVRDDATTVEALMRHYGGELTWCRRGPTGCLSSSAWKTGSMRAALPGELFVATYSTDIRLIQVSNFNNTQPEETADGHQ